MVHVSQLVDGGIYKLYGKTVKIVGIYWEEVSEFRVNVVYDSWNGFRGNRSVVRETGETDFEELTSLEKELL